jgi:GntR family transcriptional regulator
VKTRSPQPKEAVPLYSRVESLIRNKILSGRLEAGEKLPSEDELTRHFRVSRITIRSALSHLQNEGLIVRNHGRGTFVAEDIPVKKQFVFTGGVHDIVLDAQKYKAKPLGIENIVVSEARYARDVAEFLSLNMDDPIVLVRRVRLLKGTPIYFLENFMLPTYGEHLSESDLAQKPLLKALKEEIGLSVGRGEMFIEAVPADPDVAEILEAQIFEPLILFTVQYWLASGEPFEVVNCFMRPDYFKYKVEIDAKGFENI